MRLSPWRSVSTGSRRAAGGRGGAGRLASGETRGVATLASGFMLGLYGARGKTGRNESRSLGIVAEVEGCGKPLTRVCAVTRRLRKKTGAATDGKQKFFGESHSFVDNTLREGL